MAKRGKIKPLTRSQKKSMVTDSWLVTHPVFILCTGIQHPMGISQCQLVFVLTQTMTALRLLTIS